MRFEMAVSSFLVALPAMVSATTLSASMTVDNTFAAYVSTSATSVGAPFLSGANWPSTFVGSTTLTPLVDNYLHVRATDQGRPEMFIGRFTLSDANFEFVNATQTLHTVASDWTVSHTGFGVTPVAPLDIGPNGMSPWGNFPAMTSNARFLWHPTYQSTVYFTATIRALVVPEPTVLGLLAGTGLMMLRRR